MCGIFGIVSQKENQIGKKLVVGGRGLSYRGYDSVGCATVASGEIELRKDVGKIDEVATRLKFAAMNGKRGIIQLRWATFGAPSKLNAQPHFGCQKDIVGAHNGNIVNNTTLRTKFKSEGHRVRSQNDGETCVHAFEKYWQKGLSPERAIRLADKELAGDYAYIVTTAEANEIYAVKQGSGLIIGIGDNEIYCSSDLPSILPFTRKIIRMRDGELAILRPAEVIIKALKGGRAIKRKPEIIKERMDVARKGGYRHFLIKEINEQPKAAEELLHLLSASDRVEPYLRALSRARNLYLVGSGTSYHAALLGSYYFPHLAGKGAQAMVAPEFIEQVSPALGHRDVALFISQSGETKDTLNAVKISRERGAKVLGITNVIGSSLTHESSIFLPLTCGYEISVPATKTFTNQAIMLLYLAAKMGNRRINLGKLPALINQTIKKSNGAAKKVSEIIQSRKEMYYEGYGIAHPIALEGALKLKEITYVHCEGIFSSEFKHGPLSAVDKDYPVLFLAAPDDLDGAILSHINEVNARGGYSIVVTEKNAEIIKNGGFFFEVPKSNQWLYPILATIPLQLIAYYASVAKGIDPDFPRNLSKTITVD